VEQAYLRLRNLVKSYGVGNAVDNISLDIIKGEFVTLLGPSGSGKTTTLMMIAGFEVPTAGTITLCGDDLKSRKPYQRNIGVVFQNYALFPHMTVAGNVEFPLRMRSFPRQDRARRVGEVLELVGLGEFHERYPRELSGGQQQRVALARGLVFQPDVLLLDEPLGALDKNLREQMQIELKRIHREVGITMIYVTHDQSEAMTMSDRIAVFSNGRLEQVGPPLDIYNRPVTRFVAEFIGDSNIVSGLPVGSQAGVVAVSGLGDIHTRAGALSAPSKAVDILIRPERVRLRGQSDGAAPNHFEFRVLTKVDYGDSVLLVGALGELPFRVRIAGRLDRNLIQDGATIPVSWDAEDCHVILSHS
jgi:putative spermidine/putrescine transport system ATP-binding protein